MRLATVEQCRKIEDESIENYDLSGEILMEAAGALAAREVDQSFFPELKRGMTAVICGPGNNGGDGLVLARHLYSAGHRNITIFTLSNESMASELFKKQFVRVEAQGIKWVNLTDHPEKMSQIKSASLIVDALFGIGLSPKSRGEFFSCY
ncbi:MAG: NAD(P)H-hydrate epimerase [Bdellovibrionales bacterium]